MQSRYSFISILFAAIAVFLFGLQVGVFLLYFVTYHGDDVNNMLELCELEDLEVYRQDRYTISCAPLPARNER